MPRFGGFYGDEPDRPEPSFLTRPPPPDAVPPPSLLTRPDPLGTGAWLEQHGLLPDIYKKPVEERLVNPLLRAMIPATRTALIPFNPFIRAQADAAAREAKRPPDPPAPGTVPVNVGPPPEGGWQPQEDPLTSTSNAMGSAFRLGIDDQELRDQYKLYRAALGGVPGAGHPDRELTTLGTKSIISAADKKNAAIEAQSLIEGEEKKALAGAAVEGEDDALKAATEEESIGNAAQERKRQLNKKAEADRKWLDEHPDVDPYKTYRTNAGAGVMAALGAALMATGASLRKDSSFEWTKQIANLLDRETDIQLRAIQNKRANLSNTERAIKQIAETSADDFETRMRARNLKIYGLNKRIEAIKAGTESKAVVERANQLIAENNAQMGKNLADIGVHQQGVDAQVTAANLGAASAGRNTDAQLMMALLSERGGENKLSRAMVAPRLAQSDELNKLWGRADTTLRLYYDALRNPKVKDAAKNAAAKAFYGAFQALAEGTDKGGDRPEVQAYGWPRSWNDVVAKFERHDPESLSEFRNMMRRLYMDRHNFIWGGMLDPTTTPNSQYSQPPPGR